MNSTAVQTIHILVVDDEPDLVDLIAYNLNQEGFKVSSAFDGEDALEKIKTGGFDLVILDLMLPGIQGTELCSIVRSNPITASLPIIMLTAKSDITDRIQGLQSGADDYMTKPFNPKELSARVRAVLRRGGRPTRGKVLIVDSLRIDMEQYIVIKNNVPLSLSSTGFKILVYLAERKGRVFSRDQLLDALWHDNKFVEPRTVDVHIRRLRSQIEDDPSQPKFVKTRRGVGYYVEVKADRTK